MPSLPISGAILHEQTIQRLGGNGDNWCSTWAADGTLYVALCDGTGFPGMRRTTYNSRLIRVDGDPETGVRFFDVPGYPELADPLGAGFMDAGAPPTRYYGFGTLSVDGTIYQYLNTFNVPTSAAVATEDVLRFVGTKVIYSPDDGATWFNQDGTTPVRWEDWDERDGLLFFDEPGETFSLTSVLQAGQDYALNADGFVYLYSPDGNHEGTMNRLVMARVAKDRILDRTAYEFFAGHRADGSADWTTDIAGRDAVHVFPSGWVNARMHPYAWQPSVTFNPGLGVYLMANWATGPTPDGEWFGRPSYLGLYQAPNPWGPWEQFHEDTAWTPGGDAEARCYQPQIVPKWISDDGTSFWMVWTDFQTPYDLDGLLRVRDELVAADLDDDELAERMNILRPYYSFNVQRVDLVTGR
jgi:hypothetical protein